MGLFFNFLEKKMVNIEQYEGILKISFVNKDGNIEIKTINVPPEERYEWILSPKRNADANYMSWDDKNVRKISSKTLNKYRITEFLNTLSEDIKKDLFSYNEPKKYFIDIETDCSEEFWKPANPKGAIQAISIVSEKNNVMVLGTKAISDERIKNIEKKLNEYFIDFSTSIKFKYILFEDEYEMLFTFFNTIIKNYALITGWNFLEFDWAYLINRAKLLNIEATAASISNKLTGKDLVPLHKIVIDYLEIYKKWDRVVEVKESNTLDWVAEEVLGLNKIKYSGTLADLYRNDYENFIFYNAVDSLLVRFIDKKLNSLSPYLKLSYLTKTEYSKAFSPVAMIENIMVLKYQEENKVFVCQENNTKENIGYEGAYVMEPITGYHKWLMTYDFSSEYPTVMRQWNMSPETFIKVDKNLDISKHPELIKAANGAIFKNDVDGILRILLTDLFKQRKDAQKHAKDIEKEISLLKTYLK